MIGWLAEKIVGDGEFLSGQRHSYEADYCIAFGMQRRISAAPKVSTRKQEYNNEANLYRDTCRRFQILRFGNPIPALAGDHLETNPGTWRRSFWHLPVIVLALAGDHFGGDCE